VLAYRSNRNAVVSHANRDKSRPFWISEPSSVSERRSSLLHQMGLSNNPSLSRTRPTTRDFGRSASSDRLTNLSAASAIVQSKLDGNGHQCDILPYMSSVCSLPILSIYYSSVSLVNNNDSNSCIIHQKEKSCIGDQIIVESQREEEERVLEYVRRYDMLLCEYDNRLGNYSPTQGWSSKIK